MKNNPPAPTSEPSVKSQYEKPPELYDGLRLHQNENTRGCSPRVIEALARLKPEQIGFYPPYAAVTEACARYFGVTSDRLTLVNGLDEGIMAIAVAYLRPAAGQRPGSRSDRAGTRLRNLSIRHGGRRRACRAGHAEPGLQLRRRSGAVSHHGADARGVPDEPEQSHRRAGASRGDPQYRAAGAQGSDRVRGRGVRRVCRSLLHPGTAGVSKRHRRPHVFQGVRPRRPQGRRAGWSQRHPRPGPVCDSRLQPEYRRGGGSAGGARRYRATCRSICDR